MKWLANRKAPGPSPRLNKAQRWALAEMVETGAVPAVHGMVRWRLVDLAQRIWEQFRIAVSAQTASGELHALTASCLPGRAITPRPPGRRGILKNVWPAQLASDLCDLT
jgi:hypothetical protein